MQRPVAAVFCALLALVGPPALAENKSERSGSPAERLAHAQSCANLMNARTAAYVADDWPAMIRLGEQYLRACKDTGEESLYASAYGDIADAQLSMGNYRKALAAADSCLLVSYVYTQCHVIRVEALLGLARNKEAMASLNTADRLIEHRAEFTRNHLAPGDLEGADLLMMQAEAKIIDGTRKRAEIVRAKMSLQRE